MVLGLSHIERLERARSGGGGRVGQPVKMSLNSQFFIQQDLPMIPRTALRFDPLHHYLIIELDDRCISTT